MKLEIIPDFNGLNTVNLAKCLEKEWNLVKEEQLLTRFILKVFEEFSSSKSDPFTVERANRDSRTGGFFEDIFCFLLNSYLRSKPDLRTPEYNFEKIKICLNESVPVPEERVKRKPDILIKTYKTGEPICIIELKASYTKRTLLKSYNADYEMWKRLNENITFLYVILRSNSKNKTNTYKKAKGCRVICWDLKIDEESKIKRIVPKIDTSIESVFEEIYQSICNFDRNKFCISSDQNALIFV